MSNIQGNNIGAPITPFTTNDIYPTHYSRFGSGGVVTGLTSVAERDAILVGRREWGMSAVLVNGTTYQLIKGFASDTLADNANWKLYTATGGSVILYNSPGPATDGAMSQAATTAADQALQTQLDTLESDLTDAENAILALENLQDKYVLKAVGKQLTDQNFTLEEKQKLASLALDASLFKGAYDASVAYAQGEYVVERNALYVSLFDGNVGYDVDFADADGVNWWAPVLQQNPNEAGLAYALLYAEGQNIVLETDKSSYSVPVPAAYDDAALSARVAGLEVGKVDRVAGKQLTDVNFTQGDKDKLDSLQNSTAVSYDDTSLKNRFSGVETRVAGVENALPAKVDKVAGKQLSTEDYTSAEKGKLASLVQGLTEETLPQAFVNIQDAASQLSPVVNGNGKLLLYLTNDVVKSWHIANGHVALDKLSPEVLELLNKPAGDTVLDFTRQGNSLVLTTDAQTRAVDLSDLAGGGGTTTYVASDIEVLAGTLDAAYSGLLPANTAKVLSLVVADGYALMSHEYSVNLAAGTFTIHTATATSLSALVAGDRYEVVAQRSGGGNAGSPAQDSKTLEFVFHAGFANDFSTLIGPNQAAEYTTQQLSNVASVAYSINNSPVALPFSVLAGDTLKVAITRTDNALGSIVSVAN